MRYMLLIYNDETVVRSDEEARAHYGEYLTFTDEIRAEGVFVDGAPLAESSSATCVQVRDGDTITLDGPYAETKEQLGGYYIVECVDLDAALAIAARMPGAREGTIEVRPLPR